MRGHGSLRLLPAPAVPSRASRLVHRENRSDEQHHEGRTGVGDELDPKVTVIGARHADLIAMGSHGYGFLERLVNHARCSVLVVRGEEPA